MCWMNLWAVNSSAYTKDFVQFTTDRLGTVPDPVEMRIISSRIRPSAVVFTLSPNMCDCSALIGSSDGIGADEISAEAWLGWIHSMADVAPYLSRLAVLHTWSADGVVTPTHARGIDVDQVDEQALRAIGEDSLLTIDQPR